MSKAVIEVENLSKLYNVGMVRAKTLREAAEQLTCRLMGKTPPSLKLIIHQFDESQCGPKPNTFWALKDISFKVNEGEAVGIIGRNGAGKSTLLKILSHITEPTSGRAVIRGRVSSLLEIGTGFHPELTGRENIYLNGAILGMRRWEINRKYKSIVDFAEIESFIDTPVKRYSSGMYVRLAFAVAAHLDPEILLVDEVLAVGDMLFQKKCMAKMSDITKSGRTILFVSHNIDTVARLTTKALLLEKGVTALHDETGKVLSRYFDSALDQKREDYHASVPKHKIGVTRARVITSEPKGFHRFGAPLKFEFEIQFPEKPNGIGFAFEIIDAGGRPLTSLWLFDSDKQWSRQGKVTLVCTIPEPRLYKGQYALRTHLSRSTSYDIIEKLENICGFVIKKLDSEAQEYRWEPRSNTHMEIGNWNVD
jgi:lipopolysaccharide transport system ATP-binding protein